MLRIHWALGFATLVALATGHSGANAQASCAYSASCGSSAGHARSPQQSANLGLIARDYALFDKTGHAAAQNGPGKDPFAPAMTHSFFGPMTPPHLPHVPKLPKLPHAGDDGW
ncbi:MAG: hypothetical protein JWL84_6042 [Rhodospirillales bacterium]|nr:hypothetical protein [Rhodospirillales bacterium]